MNRAALKAALAASVLISSWPSSAIAVAGEDVSTATPPALDPAAAKKAAAEERKRQRQLVAQYGLGPYPDEIDAYLADKPEALRPYYKSLYTGGERNAVLNFQRLGLAAFDAQEWRAAEWAFDRALERIEAIYANNPQAEAARSTFRNEANKDFKGEPYERSMAYYYRGLLYLRKGDFDNARASFKAAEYQDTLSESETFQSDFAVMNYLVGWTFHCQQQESSAKEAFEIAKKAQAGLEAPAADDNVLMLAELGNGPVKERGGTSEELLVFKPGPAYPENGVSFSGTAGNGAKFDRKAVVASSVNYQATTRGGRAIDGVMKGKANFKETTSAVGQAAMQAGLLQGGNSGMASMGVGLLFSLMSSAAKTKADIRAWDGLPDQIHVATAASAAAPSGLAAHYLKGEEAFDAPGARMWTASAGKCAIVWARSRPLSLPADQIVGEDAGVAASLGRRRDIQEKNKAFRQSLS